MPPRIIPIPPREWPEEMKRALAALRPPGSENAFPSSEGRPKAMNWLGTLAHHPELALAFNTFGGHILGSSSLTARQRELLALRVAAVRQSHYEWTQHALRADDFGFQPSDIARIAEGPDAPGWSEIEGAMVSAVDELIKSGEIADRTWDLLATEFNDQQLMDFVFTVGMYELLALAFRSFLLELDDDLKPK
jgi:alkylhydroperoxidase family enzyme